MKDKEEGKLDFRVYWAIPENIHNPPMDDTELGT